MIEGLTTDPNIVYLLLLIGLWSGITAAYVPGSGIAELVSAGVSVAAIVLLAALPTNWFAVLVVLVGVAGFLLVPLIRPRYATLALVGLIFQALGSVALFHNGLSVGWPLIALTIVLSVLYHRFVLLPVLAHQRRSRELETDAYEQLLGATGRVVNPINLPNPVGTVQAGGELWTARSDLPLERGDEVIVVDRDGLVITVEGLKYKRDERADNSNSPSSGHLRDQSGSQLPEHMES